MNVELFPREGNSYYGAAGSTGPNFKVTDTRGRVETDLTKRLAGVLSYPQESIREKSPLIQLSV